MKVTDLKQEMLYEIDKREIIKNKTASIEQRSDAIIRIAAEQLSVALDEVTARNYGELPDGSITNCLSEIANITTEVLSDAIGIRPQNIRSLILTEYIIILINTKK